MRIKKKPDPKDRRPTWVCFVCRCPGPFQMLKMVQESLGYHEDEKGDLQMNLETREDFVWVCEEHIDRYRIRGYEVVYSKNIHVQKYLEDMDIVNEIGE